MSGLNGTSSQSSSTEMDEGDRILRSLMGPSWEQRSQVSHQPEQESRASESVSAQMHASPRRLAQAFEDDDAFILPKRGSFAPLRKGIKEHKNRHSGKRR